MGHIADHLTWLPIAISDEALRKTNHYKKNKAFVDTILDLYNPSNVIYTGHSLGGSSSIAMLEDNPKTNAGNRAKAVVFNPGIGMGWTKQEFSHLDVKMHATKFDVVSYLGRVTNNGLRGGLRPVDSDDIVTTSTLLFDNTKIIEDKRDVALYHYMKHFLNSRMERKIVNAHLGICFLPKNVGLSVVFL